MTNDDTLNAVGILDGVLRDPVSRQSFYEDPDRTMRAAGADPGNVPSQVWTTLTNMTLEELSAIAALGGALAEAGLLDGSLPWLHGV
jgi:hypothetical protein